MIELIYVCFERGQGHGVATGDKCRRFGKEMSQICIVTKSFVADLSLLVIDMYSRLALAKKGSWITCRVKNLKITL